MRTLNIRRWELRHLVGISATYWAALAAITLAPFALAVASVTRLSGQRGSVTASLGDAGVTLSALKDGGRSDRPASSPAQVPIERRGNRG